MDALSCKLPQDLLSHVLLFVKVAIASRVGLCSIGMCDVMLSFLDVCAEIGQAKASEKDVGLAWERIEAFLWNHVGPALSVASAGNGIGHQQLGEQMPGTGTNGTTGTASMNRTASGSHTDGVPNGTDN